MKHKKWLLAGATGLLALGLVGCGNDDHDDNDKKGDDRQETKADKDDNIDATKYAASPKDLAKQFNKQYKGYSISEIKVDSEHGETVYEIQGFDKKANKEAKMEVKASKTSEVVRQEDETMDAEDKADNKAIDMNKVKKTPKEAMDAAKKAAKLSNNATEWKLEMNRDNKLVYKVDFDKDHKTVTVDAQTGKSLSTSADD